MYANFPFLSLEILWVFCLYFLFFSTFNLKYFKPFEKLQEQYNENPYIPHLDSPTVNSFPHLLYLCVDVYIHLSMRLSMYLSVYLSTCTIW